MYLLAFFSLLFCFCSGKHESPFNETDNENPSKRRRLSGGNGFDSLPNELLHEINGWLGFHEIHALRACSLRLFNSMEFFRGSEKRKTVELAIEKGNQAFLESEFGKYFIDDDNVPLCFNENAMIDDFGFDELGDLENFNCTLADFQKVYNEPFLKLFSPLEIRSIIATAFVHENGYLLGRLRQLDYFATFMNNLIFACDDENDLETMRCEERIRGLFSSPVYKYFNADVVFQDAEISRLALRQDMVRNMLPSVDLLHAIYNGRIEDELDVTNFLDALKSNKRMVEDCIPPDHFTLLLGSDAKRGKLDIIFRLLAESPNIENVLGPEYFEVMWHKFGKDVMAPTLASELSRIVMNPGILNVLKDQVANDVIQVFLGRSEADSFFEELCYHPDQGKIDQFGESARVALIDAGLKFVSRPVIVKSASKCVTNDAILSLFPDRKRVDFAIQLFVLLNPSNIILLLNRAKHLLPLIHDRPEIVERQVWKWFQGSGSHIRSVGQLLTDFPEILDGFSIEFCRKLGNFAKAQKLDNFVFTLESVMKEKQNLLLQQEDDNFERIFDSFISFY